MDAEYLWKDGKDYLPVCRDCAADWLIEDALRDQMWDIEDLEEEEIKEMVKK